MFRSLLLQFLVLFTLNAFSQGPAQLQKNYLKLTQSGNDTAKVNALNFLAKYHINVDQDSGRFYVEKALTLAEKLNYPKGLGQAHLTLGILESDIGNYPEGLDHILKAIEIAEKTEDHHLLAGCKLNLGNFYFKTGDIDKALETYRNGLDICNQYGLYYTQASLYSSIGMGLKMKGELDSALIYYEKVLDIQYNSLHDTVIIAAVYNNIAALYYQKGDLMTAENYLVKSYEINEATGNQRYMLMNLSNLGGLCGHPNGDLKKSTEYFERAIVMAKEMRSNEALESIYKSMSEVHYNHFKFKDAYDYLHLSLIYKDSILGEDKQTQIMAISEKFQTKQFQDSLRIKEQELALSQSNEEAANLKASKSTWQLLGAIFLLLCILVVLFFVYRNSKNQKRINALLQEKNDEINHQKLEIEEKNTELTDSINYAKRIQQALLPSPQYMNKVLGDHFLIFKPKDIVSGDFYWVKQVGNKICFAVADCTGHGVPGAMVSMLGYETIEKVSGQLSDNAAHFINQVNESLIHSLTSKNEDTISTENQVKDGMDLSLCIVSDKDQVSFCGANNECYIIRSNDQTMPDEDDGLKLIRGEKHTVIELKATKRPVGLFDSQNEFRASRLKLLKGDQFYLFSDGYADQFGGDKGKKMKTSTFRENLLKCAHMSMTAQKEYLENYLASWQNNFDQLDDITVLGVKVE